MIPKERRSKSVLFPITSVVVVGRVLLQVLPRVSVDEVMEVLATKLRSLADCDAGLLSVQVLALQKGT